MERNEITRIIIGAAMKFHSALGPGLLENSYKVCLLHEVLKSGLRAAAEVELPLIYDGLKMEVGYKIDLLVEDTVIVELKAVETLLPVHQAQLLCYLKLSGKQTGLLINFNVVHLRDGIKRMVNG